MHKNSRAESRKVTPLRLAIFVICGLAACFTFSYFLYIVVSGNDPYNKFMTTLLLTVMYLLPVPAHFLFGKKISDFVMIFYLAFLTVASLLGQVLRFNDLFRGYDKFCHFTFGYVGSLAGLFILCKLSDIRKLSPVLVAIVVFSVSMMCAACWEIMEFLSSRFLGQTAQGKPQETVGGAMVVDITDTMLDIISNLGGAILFVVHYILHKVTKRSLLMGAFIKDFSAGKEIPSASDGSSAANETAADREGARDDSAQDGAARQSGGQGDTAQSRTSQNDVARQNGAQDTQEKKTDKGE